MSHLPRCSRSSMMRHAAVGAVAILVAGCNLDVAQPANNPSDPATETFAPGLMVDIGTMQKTTSGVYWKDLKVGAGAEINLNAAALDVISYAGFLKTGALFTQSVNQLTAMSNLPVGLQDGMTGMHEGGERLVVVPSVLGYGNVAVPGVPPNSTLVFDIILNLVP